MLGVLLATAALAGTARGANVLCDANVGDVNGFNTAYLNGTEASLGDYAGKVLLIVNVATYWGLTIPSYNGLNALAEEYQGTDLVILGFPCNQFSKQEPSTTEEEIRNGVKYVRPGGGFEPKFDLMNHIEVNGPNQDPIYEFLNSNCGYTADSITDSGIAYSGINVHDIRWNFEKFLIARDGTPYSRWAPAQMPDQLKDDIDFLLSQ